MQIKPKSLAHSHYTNWCAERSICDILEFLDVQVSDHSNKERGPFDYRLDNIKAEQKITSGYDIPVETHKDEERSIPSGLLASDAEVVIVLSRGGSTLAPVGKLRAFRRDILLKAAAPLKGKFWPSTPTQSSYVISVPCLRDGLPHTWLGDMEATAVNGKIVYYDTETFRENPYARKDLRALLDTLKVKQ